MVILHAPSVTSTEDGQTDGTSNGDWNIEGWNGRGSWHRRGDLGGKWYVEGLERDPHKNM